MVSMLDWRIIGPMFESTLGLGLCSKGCFIHLAHFPSLAAWIDMTYDVERAVKPESLIIMLPNMKIERTLNDTDI